MRNFFPIAVVLLLTVGCNRIPNLTAVAPGPLVIANQSNVVISGRRIYNPIGDCLQILNSSKITIEASEIGPCGGRGILIQGGSDISIFDSSVLLAPSTTYSADKNDAILARDGTVNLTIQGNVIANGESNIEAQGSKNVVVIGNAFFNPQGPMPRGQQFQCSGCQGVTFTGNYGSATDGKAHQADAVNFFATSEFAAANNFLTGGQLVSGCGLMADTMSSGGQFLANLLLNTGECGIGMVDGIEFAKSNKVYNTNPIPGGGNTAMYAAHYGKGPTLQVTVQSNIADEIRPGGVHSGWWAAANAGTIDIRSNTFGAKADVLLTPTAKVFAPPMIPPGPKSCVVNSPYTNHGGARCLPAK